MHDDNTIKFSLDRRWIRRLVVVAVTLAVAIPTAAWAGHQFTDVPNSNIFHADIDWMADNDVTKGCNPPANTEYCPEDNVKRQEMAAFLHRLDTEDVFATPAEVDDLSDFAVIDADGGVLVQNGLVDASRDAPGTGAYTLEFALNVDVCSWTGAVGARDGTFVTGHILTLNADAADANVIHARVVDEDNAPVDQPFNVTVNC